MELRKLRKYKLGLTLNEMSQLTGINITTLSQWERGAVEPSIRMLKKMAQKIGIGYEELAHGIRSVRRAS